MVPIPESLSIEMESGLTQATRAGFLARMWGWVKARVVETVNTAKKIAKDDPRKVIHSMRVGLALTLVSLFYYFRPLYNSFEEAGMWTILTVVVVFEFTVGGTISKSLNRGGATLLAAALGVGAEYLAAFGGEKGEPIILAILVFILAMVSTFTRFFPNVKSRYDYGVMVFILTFTLVAVSGSRVDQIWEFARQRLITILIGGATCILISMFVNPVWAGQDLHNLVADNVEKLADFLDGFGGEFFHGDEDNISDKTFLLSYKSVLNSKLNEESLANLAWWEPPHGKFMFRRLWKHYLKIVVLGRECGKQIETLGECIKTKPKAASEFHKKFQEPCKRISTESSKALKELSSAIKSMKFPSPAVENHLKNSKSAADDLETIMLENVSFHDNDLQELMQLLLVSSTLMDIIKSVEKISASIDELSKKSRFEKATKPEKQHQLFHRGTILPCNDIPEVEDVVVIDIHGPFNGDLTKSKN